MPSVLHLSSILDNSSQTAVKYRPGTHCRPGAVLVLRILTKDRRARYKEHTTLFCAKGCFQREVGAQAS